MVVRFDFETSVKLFVKRHHARVVFKNADTPIVVAQRFANRLSGCKDRFFEHVFVLPFVATGFAIGGWALVVNATRQRFVTAVFRPSLCDGFQFNVGRVTTNRYKLIANGLHFDQS